MKQVIQGLEEGLNAIAEAVGGGGGSSIVPTPTAADEGKVLTANDDGTASWEDASGVDMTGAQAGQVLTAIQDMGGNLIQGWTTPDAGVPSTSGVTNGYVLTNQNGTPAWAAASGGGGGVGFVDDTSIEVNFDDKGYTYFLDYHPLTAGSNLFNTKSVDTMEGDYLIAGKLSLIVGYGLAVMTKTVITEAHLENANGISSVSDIIPIYGIEEYSGFVRLYYDSAKVASSTNYRVVVNGYYDTTN